MITRAKPEDKSDRRPRFGTSVFVGLTVVFLVVALSQLPVGSSPATKAVSPLPDTNPHDGNGGFGTMISNLIQNKASGTQREDFRSGACNWERPELGGVGLEHPGRGGASNILECYRVRVSVRGGRFLTSVNS